MKATALAALALVALACSQAGGAPQPPPAATTVPSPQPSPGGGATASGVETFTVSSALHVQGRVDYPQTPPVGGDHAAAWVPCGFYGEPVSAEQAVHSLEHGAVWITFRPGLADAELEALRQLTLGRTHVLVSPFPDLPAPVVASAWGRQLKLESARDPRLADFVRVYHQGPQTPEPGAPCAAASPGRS